MTDMRQKDQAWIVGMVDNDHAKNDYQVMKAVLMDLRDELKQLNRVFSCQNFQRMPHDIRELVNLAKHRRRPTMKDAARMMARRRNKRKAKP